MKPGLDNLYVTEIADDNPKLGRLAAESVVKALKEGGRSNAKIALITGGSPKASRSTGLTPSTT